MEIQVSPVPIWGRGLAAARGRGRGSRGAGSRGGRGWTRGAPLVERFVSDDELPAHLRHSVKHVLTGTNQNEARGQRMVEDNESGEESEGHHEAEEYADCGNFEWKSMHDGFQGVKEIFMSQSSGPTRAFNSAYNAFRFYWDDAILAHIAEETNRYAEGIEGEKFRKSWYPTNPDEIIILFCFWMMLSIIRMPTIKSCFSTLPILKTGIFRQLMTEERYWTLNRAFHLANGSRDDADPDNVLHPMGPVLDHLNSKFQKAYRLEQEISIDESLTLWKGALKFVQYIKTKAAKMGIKTFMLCESSTGYLWSFFVSVGRFEKNSSMPSKASTVLRLLRPLLNMGHVVFMDNWFTSPTLARYLKKKHTDCVGTVSSNTKHMPLALAKAPLAEGEYIARHSGDVAVVTCQDRRRFSCISTYHDMSQVKTRESYKLKLISDYNRGMGGVDRLDQTLEPYLIERKQCRKWSNKFLKHMLNASIQNSRILVQKSTNTKITAISFRLALVQQLMDKHLKNVPKRSQPRRRQAVHPVGRFTGQHFIQRIPITEEMAGRHRTNQGRRQCIYCSLMGRRNSRSVYECSECLVPLCLDRGCFKLYHTQ